jgi:hypothetical protein
MRHRQETVATDDWDGEFGSYDELGETWTATAVQKRYFC